MTPRKKRCDSCGQEFGFHSTTCSVFPSPNRPLSESEKFFAHLNKIIEGETVVELELMHEIDKVPQLWRVVITPKEESK